MCFISFVQHGRVVTPPLYPHCLSYSSTTSRLNPHRKSRMQSSGTFASCRSTAVAGRFCMLIACTNGDVMDLTSITKLSFLGCKHFWARSWTLQFIFHINLSTIIWNDGSFCKVLESTRPCPTGITTGHRTWQFSSFNYSERERIVWLSSQLLQQPTHCKENRQAQSPLLQKLTHNCQTCDCTQANKSPGFAKTTRLSLHFQGR